MSWLQNAVLSVCFCAVAIGIIEMLLPKNVLKNQMRLITGAVLLISMLSPFTGDIDFGELYTEKSEQIDISESVEKSVAIAAKNEINEILREHGAETAKLSITTAKDENGGIILSSVVILLNEKDKPNSDKIATAVKEKLNVDVKTGVYT